MGKTLDKPNDIGKTLGPLLITAVHAGGLPALFCELRTWDHGKLRLLLGEIDSFYTFCSSGVEKIWKTEAVKLENFVSKERSKQIDEIRDHAQLELLAVCSEIASVALYYLPDPEIPGPGKDVGK